LSSDCHGAVIQPLCVCGADIDGSVTLQAISQPSDLRRSSGDAIAQGGPIGDRAMKVRSLSQGLSPVKCLISSLQFQSQRFLCIHVCLASHGRVEDELEERIMLDPHQVLFILDQRAASIALDAPGEKPGLTPRPCDNTEKIVRLRSRRAQGIESESALTFGIGGSADWWRARDEATRSVDGGLPQRAWSRGETSRGLVHLWPSVAWRWLDAGSLIISNVN